MWNEIIIGVLTLAGTLGGAWLANRKSSALIAYRLEQLEKNADKHSQLLERTSALEKQTAVLEQQIKSTRSHPNP